MDLNNLLSQIPVPSTIYSSLLFLVTLWWLLKRNQSLSGRATKTAPEIGGAWPLIGHLHLLRGSQPLHVTLGNLADKYGPIFTLRLGLHKTLVVSSAEMAKQCFTINDKAFATRPKLVAYEVLCYDSLMFGFSPYGSYWRHVRKITTLEVLSSQRIQKLKHVMESEVKTAMKDSYEFWLKANESSSETAVTEMKKWFEEIALNVIFRMVVGKRFNRMGYEEEENERLRKALREFFDLTGSLMVSDAVPFSRWLDLDGGERKMKSVAKELDGFVQVWLEQHKRNRDSESGEGELKQDFMDVLLSVIGGGEEFNGRDTDTIVKATCLNLILAATDTTMGTLTWALSLLINNREVLNKVKHELDTQIGTEKLVEITDLHKLNYLEAIVRETLRLYPPGPLSVPHEAIEDCTVGGYHVLAGTLLLTNISKLQRDPLIYPLPLEFRPERFLTTHKDLDLRGQHFELIPFGAGRRMCPGLSFALQITHLILATLLHGFDIATLNDNPVDMLEQTGLTSIKASPLEVILMPRLSPQLYGQN